MNVKKFSYIYDKLSENLYQFTKTLEFEEKLNYTVKIHLYTTSILHSHKNLILFI